MPSGAEYPAAIDGHPERFASVEEQTALIRRGIEEFGAVFVAYLILDGVDQRDPDLLEQCESRYCGYFPDRDTFTTWALERTGLEADLDAFRLEQGVWPDDLAWNLDVMWDRMVERYAVTERLGGVYAFQR